MSSSAVIIMIIIGIISSISNKNRNANVDDFEENPNNYGKKANTNENTNKSFYKKNQNTTIAVDRFFDNIENKLDKVLEDGEISYYKEKKPAKNKKEKVKLSDSGKKNNTKSETGDKNQKTKKTSRKRDSSLFTKNENENYGIPNKSASTVQKKVDLSYDFGNGFSEMDLKKAVIMSEILDKPVSLRIR